MAVGRWGVFETEGRHRIDRGRRGIRVDDLSVERLVEGFDQHFLGPTGHPQPYLRSRLEGNLTKNGWKLLGRWHRHEGKPGEEWPEPLRSLDVQGV